MSFKGKTVIPKGQIRLPIQTDSEIVEMDFIVVDSQSPYTAIMVRLWLHALGAVSSTFHQKVKYPSHDQVKEIMENQSMARQCMMAVILHRPNTKSSNSSEKNLQQSKNRLSTNDEPDEKTECEGLEKVMWIMIRRSFFRSDPNCLLKKSKS